MTLNFVDVLAAWAPTSTAAGTRRRCEATGDWRVHRPRHLSDTAPTLAVVRGVRVDPDHGDRDRVHPSKETDRIGAVVSELRRCGIDAADRPTGSSCPAGDHTRRDDRRSLRRSPNRDQLALLGSVTRASRSPIRIVSRRPSPTAGPTSNGSARSGRKGAAPIRVIAIDGPAGSGKSTVGRRLAARLGPHLPRHRCHVPGDRLRCDPAGHRSARRRPGRRDGRGDRPDGRTRQGGRRRRRRHRRDPWTRGVPGRQPRRRQLRSP